MAAYVDKNMNHITEAQWKELLENDPQYCSLKRYESDELRAALIFDGRVGQYHWRVNVAVVLPNLVDADDTDPVVVTDDDAYGEFNSYDGALNHYQHILAERAGCEWFASNAIDKDGRQIIHFIERGNKLNPLSQDTPSFENNSEQEKSFNSW